jgi:hypothetical protein
MADYRRHYDEAPRRPDRDWLDRSDEGRSWFRDGGDRSSRSETDRGTRWEGAPEDRSYGTYRTDDRDIHDRHRHERFAGNGNAAANEYYRAARDQRDDYMRWSHGPENWGDQHLPDTDSTPSWGPRERGGYWRHYESARPHFVGRGPKGYQRSDDRIKEEICDCMTEDAMLDASEIEVDVRQGEVTLGGSVTSREQKRRAEDVAERISGVRDVTNQLRVTREGIGHNWAADSRAAGPGITSAQPVSEAAGKGTPSKSTSGTSA